MSTALARRPGQAATDENPSIMFPASFSKIEFTDEARTARGAWATEYALQQMEGNQSGVNYRHNLKVSQVELTVGREAEDIILTFRAAGKEAVEIRMNAAEFLKRSVTIPYGSDAKELNSEAAAYLQSRTRTRGIEFSATTANKLAQILHYRYG